MNDRSLLSILSAVLVGASALGGCANGADDSDGAAADAPSETANAAQRAPLGKAGAATKPARPPVRQSGVAGTAAAPLAAAHAAYLAGSYAELGDRLRDVLVDPGATALARENAFELLDKAFEVEHGSLPSSFAPPAGVTGLQLAYFRIMGPHGPQYLVRFRGTMKDASRVKGISAEWLPNGMVLDKQTKKGHFAIRRDPVDQSRGLEEFVLDSPNLAGLPPDAVVKLELELDDGAVSRGFVITHGLGTTASPEIRWPSSSASSNDPNPVVGWAPFHTPEYQPFEQRRFGVSVTRDNGPIVWEYWTRSADDVSEVALGSSAGTPVGALPPGDYWVGLSEVESRRFGGVELVRLSRTMEPLHVLR
jgi:hypothetical protein